MRKYHVQANWSIGDVGLSHLFRQEEEDFGFSSKHLATRSAKHFDHLTQRHLFTAPADEDKAIVPCVKQNFGQHANHHAVVSFQILTLTQFFCKN